VPARPAADGNERFLSHPQVQQTIASIKVQSAYRGRAVRASRDSVRSSVSHRRGSDRESDDGGASETRRRRRSEDVKAKRAEVIQTVKTPMDLPIDRYDCLVALLVSDARNVKWLVWLVQTQEWCYFNVLMTVLYTAHFALLLATGREYAVFMLLNYLVAATCIAAQLLTMNVSLFLLSHRVFESWLNYFMVLRWAVACAYTFDLFFFKVYIIPSLVGAVMLWNSADAMQMRRWLREYIGYWLIGYWLTLVGACSQLYLFTDRPFYIPYVRYLIVPAEQHNSSLLTLVAFVGKDVILEVVFPGCLKIIKRKVRKRYETRHLHVLGRARKAMAVIIDGTSKAVHRASKGSSKALGLLRRGSADGGAASRAPSGGAPVGVDGEPHRDGAPSLSHADDRPRRGDPPPRGAARSPRSRARDPSRTEEQGVSRRAASAASAMTAMSTVAATAGTALASSLV
jgi:hypothetical protein